MKIANLLSLKHFSALIICGLLGTTAIGPQVTAAELDGLVVYRDATGALTRESKKNLRELRKLAKRTVTITVWVTYNIKFQGNPELRTPDVVAAEAAAKQRVFDELVLPLLERRDVDIADNALIGTGIPGIMLEVSSKGLVSLAHDRRVKHIGYFSEG